MAASVFAGDRSRIARLPEDSPATPRRPSPAPRRGDETRRSGHADERPHTARSDRACHPLDTLHDRTDEPPRPSGAGARAADVEWRWTTLDILVTDRSTGGRKPPRYTRQSTASLCAPAVRPRRRREPASRGDTAGSVHPSRPAAHAVDRRRPARRSPLPQRRGSPSHCGRPRRQRRAERLMACDCRLRARPPPLLPIGYQMRALSWCLVLGAGWAPSTLQFLTGYRRICPTSLPRSAFGCGVNFCTRPAKQSAKNKLPFWSVVMPCEQFSRPACGPGAPQLYR